MQCPRCKTESKPSDPSQGLCDVCENEAMPTRKQRYESATSQEKTLADHYALYLAKLKDEVKHCRKFIDEYHASIKRAKQELDELQRRKAEIDREREPQLNPYIYRLLKAIWVIK